MARIAAGEREALRQLYQATSAKLFGVCLRILSDREESEDVLQDVYVTIWRRADRFDGARASVMTWVSTIARNRAIDRLRARGPMAYAEQVDDMEIADGQDSAETLLSAADDRNRLQHCLGELDELPRVLGPIARRRGVKPPAAHLVTVLEEVAGKRQPHP